MNDTKDKILDVADDLIQRVGLNAMSYKHISEAVGIRKASIHHHFPKKEDLVDGLLERCAVNYGNDYLRIVDGKGRAPEKLRKLAAVFEDVLAAKRNSHKKGHIKMQPQIAEFSVNGRGFSRPFSLSFLHIY